MQDKEARRRTLLEASYLGQLHQPALHLGHPGDEHQRIQEFPGGGRPWRRPAGLEAAMRGIGLAAEQGGLAQS